MDRLTYAWDPELSLTWDVGLPCTGTVGRSLTPGSGAPGRDASRTGFHEKGWREKRMLHCQPTVCGVQARIRKTDRTAVIIIRFSLLPSP